MKLSEVQKLTEFCNKVIIRNNHENRGLCAYIEYKDKQYFADFIFTNDNGPDFAVFPALDQSVTSWNPLYQNVEIETMCKKSFREELFKFLSTL